VIRALYTAASGMMAQETNLDTVANNLANSSTAGFRRRRVQFEDLVYQNLVMPGAAASQQTTLVAGLQVGLGTRTAASEVIQLQGDFSQTGNPLDMTIEGTGFFQVLLPSGETAYTRAGTFHLDAQGNLVTQDGNPIQPAVTIPPNATSVTVGQDGTISVTLPGQTAAQQVGALQLAIFNNPGGLNSTGSNLFLATAASGDPIIGTPGGSEGIGSIVQGMLEQSNVSVVDEFVQMIVAQRAYEANSRVVNAADQMLQDIDSLGR
jgi:flagellar basal-body rod protein FlgG